MMVFGWRQLAAFVAVVAVGSACGVKAPQGSATSGTRRLPTASEAPPSTYKATPECQAIAAYDLGQLASIAPEEQRDAALEAAQKTADNLKRLKPEFSSIIDEEMQRLRTVAKGGTLTPEQQAEAAKIHAPISEFWTTNCL
ncbi:MAG: hypothetical protein N2037_02550 [Acidimicrobiales bacterium]|nr:hypothetical protein [Acidimicrobiales bacterium]